MSYYNVWIKHGERGIMLENAEEEERPFLTVWKITLRSLKILQWVSLKEILKHRLQKMTLVRCCVK
jgi:hypothetical protein